MLQDPDFQSSEAWLVETNSWDGIQHTRADASSPQTKPVTLLDGMSAREGLPQSLIAGLAGLQTVSHIDFLLSMIADP